MPDQDDKTDPTPLSPLATTNDLATVYDLLTGQLVVISARVGDVTVRLDRLDEREADHAAQARKDRKTRNYLAAAAVFFSTILAAAIISAGSIITGHANATAAQTADRVARQVIDARQPTTDALVLNASRIGGKEGAILVLRTMQPAPLVVRK
jgi:hypothetical protein